jgi:hypothetical protein
VSHHAAVLNRPRISTASAASSSRTRLRAGLAGFDEGTFVEAHALDAKTAKKIPKRMIARDLAHRAYRVAGMPAS